MEGNLLRSWVVNCVNRFVKEYSEREGIQTRWGEPLVAHVAAESPGFEGLRTVVSPTHALPRELMPNARSVIVYFVPFDKTQANTNLGAGMASEAWARAYLETNRMILELNRYLVELLDCMGVQGASIPPTHNFKADRLVSDWSHRHVAVLAGLGSFGRNNMLITDRGACGRVGSLVTALDLGPAEAVPKERCLSKAGIPCDACIRACHKQALTENGYDRFKCYEACLENAEVYEQHGLADVCGKCVVGLPCSFRNPVG